MHALEDHCGEVRVRLEAPTLAVLFEEAARALAELMGPNGSAAAESPVEPIEVVSADRDALLVDFLNELVFMSETRRATYPEVRVAALEERRLSATARPTDSPPRHLVKAATLHGLRIEEQPRGFSARIVLDV